MCALNELVLSSTERARGTHCIIWQRGVGDTNPNPTGLD